MSSRDLQDQAQRHREAEGVAEHGCHFDLIAVDLDWLVQKVSERRGQVGQVRKPRPVTQAEIAKHDVAGSKKLNEVVHRSWT